MTRLSLLASTGCNAESSREGRRGFQHKKHVAVYLFSIKVLAVYRPVDVIHRSQIEWGCLW